MKKVLFNKVKKEKEERAKAGESKKEVADWGGKPAADTGTMVTGTDIMAQYGNYIWLLLICYL